MPLFTNEDIEAQSFKVTCPEMRTWKVKELELWDSNLCIMPHC